MTRKLVVRALLLVSGSSLVTDALAERVAEPRESAAWVVTGTVSKVFARDRGANSGFVDHIVQIRIDTVEKGQSYRKGDTIYAYAFRKKPGVRTDEPGIGGHRGLPDEGQRIRAWIKHSRGTMEALYPRWFEVLDESQTQASTGAPMSENAPSESRPLPRLYRVIQPVNDIERAAAVYGELLGHKGKRISPGRHYFDCGGTILACYDSRADGDGPAEPPRYQEGQFVYLSVPDLDATHQTSVRLGFQVHEGGIQTMPWGERMFWSTDPFGNPVSFVAAGTEFLGSTDSPQGRD